MTEVQYVVTPYDIFKRIVADNDDIGTQEALLNARQLINRIDVNIFHDEYTLLYQATQWAAKNETPLTRNILQQLLLNSSQTILNSDKITISRDKQGDERFNDILQYTLAEYDNMMDEELPASSYKGDMNLYIQTWANQQIQRVIYDMNLIQQGELRVGRKVYQGMEGANQYYRKTYSMIDSLVNERKDYLADDIDTLTMDGLDIYERVRESEMETDYVSRFGIPTIDNEIVGLKRGEMVVVQGASGAGKTRFTSGTIAYHALRMGKNVAHISLEQVPTRVYPIYQARHIVEQMGTVNNLTDTDIRRGTYNPEDEGLLQESFVDLAGNSDYGKLKIVGRDLRLDNVDDYLNELYEEFPFDVLVVDYFGLIGTTNPQSRYAELAEFANRIKSACKYFRGQGFLAVIPNQISSEVEAKLLKGDDRESRIGGAGSQDLLRGSDITITIYETPQMKDDAIMKLKVDKIRSGASIPDLYLDVDKGRSLFMERMGEDDGDLV